MPAIHALYRICPGGDCVIVFGDGSIYSYPIALLEVRALRTAASKGRFFNLPAVRRAPRINPLPYERLDDIPSGALILYEEPPYDVTGPEPECDLTPFLIYMDDVAFGYWQACHAGATQTWLRISGGAFFSYVPSPNPSGSGMSAGFSPHLLSIVCPATWSANFISSAPTPLTTWEFDGASGPYDGPSSVTFSLPP